MQDSTSAPVSSSTPVASEAKPVDPTFQDEQSTQTHQSEETPQHQGPRTIQIDIEWASVDVSEPEPEPQTQPEVSDVVIAESTTVPFVPVEEETSTSAPLYSDIDAADSVATESLEPAQSRESSSPSQGQEAGDQNREERMEIEQEAVRQPEKAVEVEEDTPMDGVEAEAEVEAQVGSVEDRNQDAVIEEASIPLDTDTTEDHPIDTVLIESIHESQPPVVQVQLVEEEEEPVRQSERGDKVDTQQELSSVEYQHDDDGISLFECPEPSEHDQSDSDRTQALLDLPAKLGLKSADHAKDADDDLRLKEDGPKAESDTRNVHRSVTIEDEDESESEGEEESIGTGRSEDGFVVVH